MKKITLSVLTTLFIISCSQSIVEETPKQSVVEYVWHSAGPDFNSENLAKLINEWNQIITDSGMVMDGANILTPTVANDNYDFIWVMKWPSMSARDAGWKYWMSNMSDKWEESIDGIMSFDPANVFAFEIAEVSPPKIDNNSGAFSNRFHFCSYNEGHDEESFKTFRSNVGSTVWSDTYWNVLLNPTFELDPKPDFVWLDLWLDDQDKNMALGKFMVSENASDYVEMFTCNTNDFNGTVIR